MKLYNAALLVIIASNVIHAMEVEPTDIQHIEPKRYQYNTLELCANSCNCPSSPGFIDNFGHSPLTTVNTGKTYSFDMEGFDQLSLSSLESIFATAMKHHSGNNSLWHFHKQFLIPLVLVIKNKKEKKQTFLSDTTVELCSILLRDLLIAQENNEQFLSILFKAGAQANYKVNTQEITGNLSTKPVFFFAKTITLLTQCVSHQANLSLVDSNGNSILHETVDDTSLPIDQKKKLITFCLERGVHDDQNHAGQTAFTLASKIAASQRKDNQKQEWYAILDMLLRVNPDKQRFKENQESVDDKAQPPQSSLAIPKSDPIPIPEAPKKSSWWPW